MRVLIVDDHSVVRRGVRQILEEGIAGVEVAETSSAATALELIWEEPWDILIADIELPGRSGLELLAEVKRTHPKIHVLILSMYGEEQFALRAVRAGADGYLEKARSAETLVEAVRKLRAGGKYISPVLAEKLADFARGIPVDAYQALSERELQVVRLIASGKSARQISEELCLSVKTIGTYRARSLEKLKLKTNTELIHYAIRNHLVDIGDAIAPAPRIRRASHSV